MSEGLLNIFYIIFSLFISGIFWFQDSNKGIERVLVSIHSALLLIAFAWAILFGSILQINNSVLIEFIFLVLVFLSAISMGISLYVFTGSKWLHLFHLWNIFALLLTLFIGLMSLSNDWL